MITGSKVLKLVHHDCNSIETTFKQNSLNPDELFYTSWLSFFRQGESAPNQNFKFAMIDGNQINKTGHWIAIINHVAQW